MLGSKKRHIQTEGAQATALMTDGTELPAKRLEADPNVLMVDCAAALQENPVSAGS